MKVATLLLFALFAVSSAQDMPTIGPNVTNWGEEFNAFFNSWRVTFGKTYTSLEEKNRRLQNFKDNLRIIQDHNSRYHTYTLGLNKFSDLTNEEFLTTYLSNKKMDALPTVISDRYAYLVGDVLPDFVDWRELGAVTDVKDQGSCASGWAFSTTGAVEAINKIARGDLIVTSEQELIDCATSYNEGCKGGVINNAFEFIVKNGGIQTQQDYPYIGTDGTCDPNKINKELLTIDGYEDVPDDVLSLQKAVANQPVSVAMDASLNAFQLYSGGIYNPSTCNETSLDHGVLIVGYGTDNGLQYWKVKNSWGTSWGEGGYMKIKRGNNTCVKMEASYPVMNSRI